MGQRAFDAPDALYDDPQREGIPILSLNRNVFHPYPPPASLIFSVFSILPFQWAYLCWSCIIYILITAACLLFFQCTRKELQITNKEIHFPLVLGLCAAPAFLDSSFGNVNSLILLLVTVYTFLFIKKHHFVAGVLLSIAFWIKLYPIILLSTVIFSEKKHSLLLGFVTGALGFGSFALWAIPIDVFKEYFFQITPAFAGQVITHTFNQSLTAFITRLISKPDMYFVYYYIMTPAWIRTVILLLPATALAVLLTVKIRHLSIPISIIIAFLSSLIPLITPIGWGYTYVLTYPALLALYAMGAPESRFTKFMYILCWAALATPSYHRIEDFGLPWQLRLLYYSRYTLSALVISSWLGIKLLTLPWTKGSLQNKLHILACLFTGFLRCNPRYIAQLLCSCGRA